MRTKVCKDRVELRLDPVIARFLRVFSTSKGIQNSRMVEEVIRERFGEEFISGFLGKIDAEKVA